MSDVTLLQILEEYRVTAEQYDNTLGCGKKGLYIV